jgi:drug/metabolite transporter (DMT)-like permease
MESIGNATNAGSGKFSVLVTISYGFYLIIVKKLMDKYNAFTFVKWIYLFGFIMVLPLAGANSNRELGFGSMDICKIGFVVVFRLS